jgi:hypothetical protein
MSVELSVFFWQRAEVDLEAESMTASRAKADPRRNCFMVSAVDPKATFSEFQLPCKV